MGRLVTWRTPIYAIVRAGGKQYRVEPNQLLDVDLIKADVGSTVDLSVLMVGGNGNVSVGTPEVPNAKVVAEVLEHGKDKKILVFKYKNKTRYRRRQGHRQDFTRLQIKEIVTEGGTYTETAEKPKSTASKRVRKPKAEAVAEPVEPEVETPVVEAEAETPAAEAVVEAKPKRAPRPRKPKAEAAPPEAEDDAPVPEAAVDEPAADKETPDEPAAEAPAEESE